jgi:UDP-glucose 4-epimerase
MRILVTGGAGFIASHVSDRLLSLGQQVSIVDDLSTGKRENLPEAAEFYELDLRDPALDDVFETEKPDVVIHHAAHANVTESVRDPRHDAAVNIGGSLNLFECCVRHRTGRVVYASTGGALYGEACYIPADETHPIDPVSPYGVSKHAVEQYLYSFKENHGLEYVVLRYPNVYGPPAGSARRGRGGGDLLPATPHRQAPGHLRGRRQDPGLLLRQRYRRCEHPGP